MAGFKIEGTLYVDLVDFYLWAAKQLGTENPENCSPPRFSATDQAYYLDRPNEQSPLLIEGAEFWNWIMEEHVPNGMIDRAEILFGVPRIQSSDIWIDFAACTEGHPMDWTDKPKCANQWDEARASEAQATEPMSPSPCA